MEVGLSRTNSRGWSYCFHHKRLEAAESGSVVSQIAQCHPAGDRRNQSSELLQLANRERQPVDVLTLAVVSVFGEEGNASYVFALHQKHHPVVAGTTILPLMRSAST